MLLRFDFLAEVQEETVLVDKVLVDTNSWFLQILFKFLDKNRLTVWFGFSSFLEIFFRFGLFAGLPLSLLVNVFYLFLQ